MKPKIKIFEVFPLRDAFKQCLAEDYFPADLEQIKQCSRCGEAANQEICNACKLTAVIKNKDVVNKGVVNKGVVNKGVVKNV